MPRPRSAGSNPESWSRFDTTSRTIYASDSQLVAYLELLAPYRLEIDDARSGLQPAADAMGMSLEDYWALILEDWDANSGRDEIWLPRNFRRTRATFELKFPEGWWLDLTAAESIAALHKLFASTWETAEGTVKKSISRSDLESDDRIFTTAVAETLRAKITLDDGSAPLGIKFESKHGSPADGSGACWAYWMRDVDAGRTEPTKQISATPIDPNDPDLVAAQKLTGITLK